MQLIFSKKGMDSEYGKVISPILADGTMLSLPIPRPDEKYSYADTIYYPLGKSLRGIIEDLTEFKFNFENYKDKKDKIVPYRGTCHRDPDIYNQYYENTDEWYPALGYTSGNRLKIDEIVEPEKGDIFLFYGTFKPTYIDKNDNKLKYIERYEEFHAIFGYLEVNGKVDLLDCNEEEKIKYKNHPHSAEIYQKCKKNILFTSTPQKCGTFKFSEKLILTAPYRTKSVWKLPSFFSDEKVKIIPKPIDNVKVGKHCEFISQGIGQEIVVTVPDELQPKLSAWVKGIIKAGTKAEG